MRLKRLVREHPLGTFGALILLVLILVSIFADSLAPFRHYLREARAGKGSCQPAVECGQPSAACGRKRRKVKVGELSITLQAILDGPIQGCAQRDVIRPERMPPESQNRCRRAITSVRVADTVR